MKKFIYIFLLVIFLYLLNPHRLNLNAAIISPDKYYIDAKPGESKRFELKILSDARQVDPLELYIFSMKMEKIGEEDDRDFDVPNVNDKSIAANWIDLEVEKIVLQPSQIVSIPFTLNISEIARCGTNLASIFVSTAPREQLNRNLQNEAENSSVGIRNALVSQLHINIDELSKEYCDEVKSELDLLEFKVDSSLPVFNYDNITFVTRIKNNGNLLSQSPKGFIELFGTGPKITIPFNEDELDIYPGTIRRFTNTWIDSNYPVNGNFIEQLIYELTHFRFGQYEARLGITFNANPKIISTISLWIIPWRIILIALILIIAVSIFVLRDRVRAKELKDLKRKLSKN